MVTKGMKTFFFFCKMLLPLRKLKVKVFQLNNEPKYTAQQNGFNGKDGMF